MRAATARLTPTPQLVVAAGFAAALVAGLVSALAAYAVDPIAVPALALGAVYALAVLRRPVLGVAGGFLLSPFESFSVPLPSGAITLAETSLALVGAGYLGRLVALPHTVRRPQAGDLWFGAFLVVALLGIVVATDPTPILRTLALWSASFLLYLQVRSFTLAEKRLTVIALVVGAGVLGAIGTLDYLRGGGATLGATGNVVTGRAAGTFENANYYASFLQLAVVAGLAVALASVRRLWVLGPTAAAAAGLAFSLSRGGMLGAFAGAAVLLLWNRARRVGLGLLAVVCALLLFDVNPVPGTEQLNTVQERLIAITDVRGSATNSRPRIWRMAVQATEDNPLIGVGLYQFSFEAQRRGLTEYGRPLENAHMLPLGIAVETGLLGLAAFALFLRWVAVCARRALRSGDPEVKALAVGLTAALAGFLVQGLTVVQLRHSLLTATFLVLCGLLVGLGTAERARAPRA
jgi:putative inorganic carbon (hco3(-)) transporter